jgi:hypothetical protein
VNTEQPQLALRHELAARLLEELIYERVRAHVDLLELGLFEADLDLSIRRLLADLDRSTDPGNAELDIDDPPSAVLATALIDRAWMRVVAEWQSRQTGDIGDDNCPVCRRIAYEKSMTEVDEEIAELEELAAREELAAASARAQRRPRARKAAAQ